jgi:hypothetical protein
MIKAGEAPPECFREQTGRLRRGRQFVAAPAGDVGYRIGEVR